MTEDLITEDEAERVLGQLLDSQEPLTQKERRAFMKLPIEERRRIMAKQAHDLAEHYRSDAEWRAVEGDDIIEY